MVVDIGFGQAGVDGKPVVDVALALRGPIVVDVATSRAPPRTRPRLQVECELLRHETIGFRQISED